ncbi:Zinc finger in N-recognin family protein [Planoprotostelium fungivorum]|uniref:Zinc finger in N-recognin family protein n=1 Tax=Planoprotostelium fungivorum TaxID=1890364 RepID=A0A2P6N2R1_9EUKA|nr:Zinc finger in N-recognin family protein [Planoprotostelium fungivorum]
MITHHYQFVCVEKHPTYAIIFCERQVYYHRRTNAKIFPNINFISNRVVNVAIHVCRMRYDLNDERFSDVDYPKRNLATIQFWNTRKVTEVQIATERLNESVRQKHCTINDAFECLTCNWKDICITCSSICHKGHKTKKEPMKKKIKCYCGLKQLNKNQTIQEEKKEGVPKEKTVTVLSAMKTKPGMVMLSLKNSTPTTSNLLNPQSEEKTQPKPVQATAWQIKPNGITTVECVSLPKSKPEKTDTDNTLPLPPEILEMVCSFLRGADLCRLQLVCRYVREFIYDNQYVWRSVYKSQFQDISSVQSGNITPGDKKRMKRWNDPPVRGTVCEGVRLAEPSISESGTVIPCKRTTAILVMNECVLGDSETWYSIYRAGGYAVALSQNRGE